VRFDPFSGCIVAFTSNAKRGMWHELIDELRIAGLAVKDCCDAGAQGRPIVPPPGCPGIYQNGNVEVSIAITETGTLSFTAGDAAAEFTCFDDLSFFAPTQPKIRGHFMPDPISGEIGGFKYGLYVFRRQPATRANRQYLHGTAAARAS
jgi:hypothetical protein